MQGDKDRDALDGPIRDPLYNVGDKIMGFATHYPVSGAVKNIRWNDVNLEWEYFIENGDGFDGKIKESKILKFDQIIWDYIEAKWKIYLKLMGDAAEIELECRKLLRR